MPSNLKITDIGFVAGVAILLFFTLYPESYAAFLPQEKKEGEPETQASPRKNPFEELSLTADNVFVYDIANDEILYEKNAHTQKPIASLTKIMTAIAVREVLDESDTVTVDSYAIAAEGDSGLLVDDEWGRDELLSLALVSSSNDASRAFRHAAKDIYNIDLVAFMNEKAQALGLRDTSFLNVTGLDITHTVSGGYSTAHDIARLLAYAYHNHFDLFYDTAHRTGEAVSRNKIYTFQNTNEIINSIPSPLISKTGFTDLAGGTLAVVFEKEPRHPIAVVVLDSTQEERFHDMERLVWASISARK